MGTIRRHKSILPRFLGLGPDDERGATKKTGEGPAQYNKVMVR